jgi:hypothetical protein
MSNWPQRSVSASDQHWICFFGPNPAVLSEWTVSDISCHRFEVNREGSRPVTVRDIQAEALVRNRKAFLSLKLILRLSFGAVKINLGGQAPSVGMMPRNIEADPSPLVPAKRKNFSRFAHEQTGFALGQVSAPRRG